MKKFFFFLSAIALLGLTAACVEQQEVNPNFNPQTREVNANFVFNVATNDTPVTKMTADNVQAVVDNSSKFRGIENGHVFAFTLPTDGKVVTEESTSVGKVYELPTLVEANNLSGTDQNHETDKDKSHRVFELSIPTGTNAFMVYGKAIKTDGQDNEQGKVSYDFGNHALSDITFGLTERLERGDPTDEFTKIETLIAHVMTEIINTKGDIQIGRTTYQDVKWSSFAQYDRTSVAGKRWSVATTSPITQQSLTPLGEILGSGFAKFMNIRGGAVRAGSGQSVARMVGDLAVSIGQVAKASSTSDTEEGAIQMAKIICDEFAKYFKIADGGQVMAAGAYNTITTNANEVDWRDAGVVIDNLGEAGNPYEGVGDGHLRHFPTEFGLPMGAAQMKIQEDPKADGGIKVYYTSTTLNVFDTGAEGVTYNVKKLTYPAELCYFGNSPIRVDDASHNANEYPDGASNGTGEWLNDESWTGTWSSRGAHVLSSTRSVAMADNINYGTALLVATIGYSTRITPETPLVDNKKAFFQNEEPRVFNTSTPNLFYLTGILVGGQYKEVGWNYITKNPGADNKDFVVYDMIADPVSASTAATTDGSANRGIGVPSGTGVSSPNYTLLWDNYNGTDTQDNVYVALEFTNNSDGDFWGEHNVIRKGGTFYIVGKLTVPQAQDVQDFPWPATPDYYALPPYKNGATDKVVRIFMQDYKTVVNFKIGPESLKHAYVTVPDLRSSQMSLGLSVDLQWRAGLTQSVVLGETN